MSRAVVDVPCIETEDRAQDGTGLQRILVKREGLFVRIVRQQLQSDSLRVKNFILTVIYVG